MSLFSDPNFFLLTTAFHGIEKWNISSGNKVLEYQGSYSDGNCICLSPDEKLIVVACCDKTLKIWKTDFLSQPLQILEGHGAEVKSVIFYTDGKNIVSGDAYGVLIIWYRKTESEEFAFLRTVGWYEGKFRCGKAVFKDNEGISEEMMCYLSKAGAICPKQSKSRECPCSLF